MTPEQLAEQFGLELHPDGRVYKGNTWYSLFSSVSKAYHMLYRGDLDFLTTSKVSPSLGFKIAMDRHAVPSAMYILIKGI